MMIPDLNENLDELIEWYEKLFTVQMVRGSNIRPKTMDRNLAVLRDAVNAYRQWREHRKIARCPSDPSTGNFTDPAGNDSGQS